MVRRTVPSVQFVIDHYARRRLRMADDIADQFLCKNFDTADDFGIEFEFGEKIEEGNAS